MLMAMIYRLSDQVRRALARRHALAALRALDDRMLKDIGLSRSDIPAVVESAATADPAPSPERALGEAGRPPVRLASCTD